MGRRTKLTPETAERIINAVRAGASFEAAAGAAGIGETTLYRWLKEAEQPRTERWKREFREGLYRARDEVEVRVVAGSVMKSAMGGYVVKRVTRERPDGTVETEEQIAPADGRVGLKLLAMRFPDRWSERREVAVSGQVEVMTSTIGQLAERLAAELGQGGGEVVDAEVVRELGAG
ncbi:transposase [Microbispora sp. NPDC049125]|uniref:transposase n=1 Tax=Microbispora sp. NPDC049125 TaxID=3154929 RepID=UPI00346747EB